MKIKRNKPVRESHIRVGHIYYMPFNGEFKAASLERQPVVELVILNQKIRRTVQDMVKKGERLYRSKSKAKRIGFNA